MNRPVAQTHLSQLAELLSWMDEAPERRSLAPEARTPEGLWWEVLAGEDEKAWVWLEAGRVQGYGALVPFWDGAALEGPIIRAGDGQALLEHLVKKARQEGFPKEDAASRHHAAIGQNRDLGDHRATSLTAFTWRPACRDHSALRTDRGSFVTGVSHGASRGLD